VHKLVAAPYRLVSVLQRLSTEPLTAEAVSALLAKRDELIVAALRMRSGSRSAARWAHRPRSAAAVALTKLAPALDPRAPTAQIEPLVIALQGRPVSDRPAVPCSPSAGALVHRKRPVSAAAQRLDQNVLTSALQADLPGLHSHEAHSHMGAALPEHSASLQVAGTVVGTVVGTEAGGSSPTPLAVQAVGLPSRPARPTSPTSSACHKHVLRVPSASPADSSPQQLQYRAAAFPVRHVYNTQHQGCCSTHPAAARGNPTDNARQPVPAAVGPRPQHPAVRTAKPASALQGGAPSSTTQNRKAPRAASPCNRTLRSSSTLTIPISEVPAIEAITRTGLETDKRHMEPSYTLAYALGVLRRPQAPLGTQQTPLQVMDSCAPDKIGAILPSQWSNQTFVILSDLERELHPWPFVCTPTRALCIAGMEPSLYWRWHWRISGIK
jgi:hypothetical protein